MGCIQAKCCRRYPSSSDGDDKDESGLYPGQNTHIPANMSLDVVDVPSHNFSLSYSVLTHRGYYPETLIRKTKIVIVSEQTFRQLRLVIGDKLYVANVGDSRAVLAVKEGNRVVAQDLSCDQTPFRKDECERVKGCGARVLSVDQVEGLKDPRIQSWGDEETEGGDPPRLWVQDGMYPGTAFTRSVGDSTAEKIGVVADPEVSTVQLTPNHPFFVVASDGVFEFLSSQTVVDMVNKYADPRDACAAIADESYKLCRHIDKYLCYSGTDGQVLNAPGVDVRKFDAMKMEDLQIFFVQ
ncbi:hypothetical protein DH2020_048952 [Rehmannia glutinosa]|uniref:PPM-type phosphatase domain-containing protein n=1 Tax=Rehmannia glutinosa TaxID=99300 RepID=A0ABR0U485_REHGL